MIEKCLLIEALLFGTISALSGVFSMKFMRVLSLASLIMAYVLTLIAVIVILGG